MNHRSRDKIVQDGTSFLACLALPPHISQTLYDFIGFLLYSFGPITLTTPCGDQGFSRPKLYDRGRPTYTVGATSSLLSKVGVPLLVNNEEYVPETRVCEVGAGTGDPFVASLVQLVKKLFLLEIHALKFIE